MRAAVTRAKIFAFINGLLGVLFIVYFLINRALLNEMVELYPNFHPFVLGNIFLFLLQMKMEIMQFQRMTV